ncbi:MAG: AAA family ATPase [Gemmatimonadales bacterium]
MGLPFTLRCLGRPALLAPNGDPVRFRTRKHLALLVYLAVEPRVIHRRDRLAELLWPNVLSSEARHSLATAVSVLRARLGREAIEGNRDHLRLALPDLAVDVRRLEAGDILGDDFTPALDVGRFLEDFEVPEAPDFTLWKDRQSARYTPLVRDALVHLIDRCRRTGNFRRMEQLGNLLLELDDLSEDGIRAKMEGRAFDGDRLTALKVFEGWKQRLAEELAAQPSSLLEGIALRLRRRGLERTAASPIPTVPTDQWRGRPFVGREPEYQILYESWERTLRHAPRHVLITGDSGVGKTTLLERVVTAAGLEGAAISRVQCYDPEREIPYAVIASLVQGLLGRPGVSATPPEWLGELARTVPEVRRRFPGVPEAADTQGETARIRLTEAVLQLVLALAEEHPVILVVDDVHLADDTSLAVLHLLMRRTPEERLMLLFAARTGELGGSPHAARLLETSDALGLRVLELQPMTPQECGLLLDSLVPPAEPQPSPPVRRALLDASAGYPMVLEYLVQDWQLNGEQCLALSIGAMTEEPRTARRAEHAYRLIQARLAQGLDGTARNVLSLAAVLGARLNDLEMYSLADLTAGQTMTALARLTDIRILRDGGRGLEFCNELVRGETYLAVPATLRKALHGGIAERLLGMADTGQPAPGLEIAWHCIRAGRTEEATPYLLSGAREAIRRGAPHEAERGLGSALGWLQGEAREEAMLLVVEALQEQGEWVESLDHLMRTETADGSTRAQKKLLFELQARRHLAGFTVDEARKATDSALTIATDEHLPDTIRVQAIRTATTLVGFLGGTESVSEVRIAIDRLSDAELDVEDRAQLIVSRANLLARTDLASRAIEDLKSLTLELPAHGIRDLALNQALNGLGCLLCGAGNYEEALLVFQRAYDLAVVRGDDRYRRTSSSNRAICLFRLGRYSEQELWTAETLRAPIQGAIVSIIGTVTYAAWSMALRGRPDEALPILRQYCPVILGWNLPWMTTHWHLRYADCLMSLGMEAAASDEAEKAVRQLSDKPKEVSCAGPFARWVARLGVLSGDAAAASKTIDRMFGDFGRLDMIDRTELLCARCWLDGYLGGAKAERLSDLRRLLRELPPAVTGQLASVAALPPLGSD